MVQQKLLRQHQHLRQFQLQHQRQLQLLHQHQLPKFQLLLQYLLLRQ
jgi:hypothetical protein